MVEIILFLTTIISIAVALVEYKERCKVQRQIDIKKYSCRYNEQTGCYGMCCNLCDIKKECQWCCSGNHKYCGGIVEER